MRTTTWIGQTLPVRRFQVDIAFAFTLLLLLTVGGILYYNYRVNEASFLRQSRQHMASIAASVEVKTLDYLKPAADFPLLAQEWFAPGEPLDLLARPRLEGFLLKGLAAYPQLDMLYIGDAEGDRLMAKRLADGPRLQAMERRDGAAYAHWYRRNAAGEKILLEPERIEAYDPRSRSWYRGAAADPDVFWTDLYVFHTGRRVGLTASAAIREGAGPVRGVAAADISLENLSAFLETLRVGERGLVLILDAENRLVAFPDSKRAVQLSEAPTGAPRPRPLADLGEPWLVAAVEEWKAVRSEAPRAPEDSSTSRPTRRAARENGQDRDARSPVEPVGRSLTYVHDGDRYLARFIPLPKDFDEPWTIVVAAPEADFIRDLKRAQHTSILLSVGFFLIAVLAALLLARQLSRPLEHLSAATQRIRRFDLSSRIECESRISEVVRMTESLASMQSGLRAFQRYVPAELVRELIETGAEARLGGELRELTIFFSDIEAFTPVAERLEPEVLTRQLTAYFDRVTRAITAHYGTVDKYIGDSVMAFWNAPRPLSDHAAHACGAALACQEAVDALNAAWSAAGRPLFRTRIGMHTAMAVVGNVGSHDRLNYTVLGDAVNLASRLEGVNKLYGTRTTVTDAVARAAGERFLFRPLDVVHVRGRSEGVAIQELMAEAAALTAAERERLRERCARFAEAVRTFRQKDWHAALAIFRSLAHENPEDRPVGMYIERCERLIDPRQRDAWREAERDTVFIPKDSAPR